MAQPSSSPALTLALVPSRSVAWGDTLWFDDGFYPAVQGFKIYYDSSGVNALQLTYVQKDGKVVQSPLHGTSSGTNLEVNFDSGDYLSAISGLYAEDRVNSLTFTTTSKTYGPYGVQSGTAFSSTKEGVFPALSVAKVTGFFGRAGTVLKAVGVTYY